MTAAAGKITQTFRVDDASVGERLDQFLTIHLREVSRARVQQLIEQQRVSVVTGEIAREIKASSKLRAGEVVIVEGDAAPPPLRAEPEDIPLDILYEDEFLAIINKPAGMMVHAGSGATENARNRGTLVNALLHHMATQAGAGGMATLSATGGPLRPGIVHRLDKQTSGAILVAKNDRTHRRLGEMFARRDVRKTYLALVHGSLKSDTGTLDAPISRDSQRRTRMTTRRAAGRAAVSHYEVLERIDSGYGHFTLVQVKIETGRTHQIRVHLSSIGHPVVGDTLYGAPLRILPQIAAPASRAQKEAALQAAVTLQRNFLHAARLELAHPETGAVLAAQAPLPGELIDFLSRLRGQPAGEALLESKR